MSKVFFLWQRDWGKSSLYKCVMFHILSININFLVTCDYNYYLREDPAQLPVPNFSVNDDPLDKNKKQWLVNCHLQQNSSGLLIGRIPSSGSWSCMFSSRLQKWLLWSIYYFCFPMELNSRSAWLKDNYKYVIIFVYIHKSTSINSKPAVYMLC